ncbi:unnamed protein product [Rhizoctonia solani]|uniref:CHAT domain-containing protein n=1 Tax=Rhizoctonia solani TaxID=456999 RepID=A0A8H3HIE0_9AGAM|nr:unnamed protein product [Rhizoctonia solani]CAE6512017.1 unnamed protein product [Rhizoctonia solani]
MNEDSRKGTDSTNIPMEAKRNELELSVALEQTPEQQKNAENEPITPALNSDTQLHPKDLGALGWSHFQQFRRLGTSNDLEKAVECFSLAIRLTPDGDPDLAGRLIDLGIAYGDRFQSLGELEDLNKAIEYTSRAVSLTPTDHPDMSRRLANPGMAYYGRYQHLGDLGDLERSIDYNSRAVELAPDGDIGLPYRLATLGSCYTARFHRLGELGDLEKAIECDSSALTLTPDGHPGMSRRLAGLAASYALRFQCLGSNNDLNKSVELSSRALALTPDGHPDLPSHQFGHALSLLCQYRYTGDPTYLNNSLDFFRRASTLTGAPQEKFRFARRWATLASKFSSLNAMEAYQRYQDLSTVENLAVNAASIAVIEMDYSLALEWLEHARCVVWSQSLMLRSPLDQLHAIRPELATRLRTVAHQLHNASSDTQTFRNFTSDSIPLEQAARQRRDLAKEYQNLLAQARQLPNFQDFLQPIKAYSVIRVARNGPIVVLNFSTNRCDALFLFPGSNEISSIPLRRFTQKKAHSILFQMEKSLRLKQLRQRGVKVLHELSFEDGMGSVLATLWSDIVKPILDFLGYTYDSNRTDILPHITWCPTGVLSFLPLHAAGDYSQPKSKVFDYVISSYTPTLTALLVPTPSILSHSSRVLAVGQANTPGQTPLPGIIEELAHVKAHTHDKAKYSQLIDNQATTTAVLEAMEQHDWVHLACHAHQNVTDPTKSGFFLSDGILDLASINQRSFRNKGFAFLSACQTATGDEKLPDEAIHLASGMLMAGYSSVIATMWSVVDEDAPFVADKVYTQLMKHGKIGDGEAGKALHNAVAELRDKVGEKEFGRWAPYIHIGS